MFLFFLVCNFSLWIFISLLYVLILWSLIDIYRERAEDSKPGQAQTSDLSKILFSLLVISERWVLYISYEVVIPEEFCNFLFLEYNLKSGLWIQGCIKSLILLTSRFLRTFSAQAKCSQLGGHSESWVQQRWWMLKAEMCPISGCVLRCDLEIWECNPKLTFLSEWLTLGRPLGFVQTTSFIPSCCSFFWVTWRKFSSLPSSCQWMFRLQTTSEHRCPIPSLFIPRLWRAQFPPFYSFSPLVTLTSFCFFSLSVNPVFSEGLLEETEENHSLKAPMGYVNNYRDKFREKHLYTSTVIRGRTCSLMLLLHKHFSCNSRLDSFSGLGFWFHHYATRAF